MIIKKIYVLKADSPRAVDGALLRMSTEQGGKIILKSYRI
jgi:hypothetical protein